MNSLERDKKSDESVILVKSVRNSVYTLKSIYKDIDIWVTCWNKSHNYAGAYILRRRVQLINIYGTELETDGKWLDRTVWNIKQSVGEATINITSLQSFGHSIGTMKHSLD